LSVKVYVEGGGNSKALKSDCRKGFSKFVEKAGMSGRMPGIVACGSRNDTFDDFKTAIASGQSALLLVDAEELVKAPGAWQHLEDRDKWIRPVGATDDQCHLMVQVMESWFLADTDALKSFYGQKFQELALPQNPKIEDVPKLDVQRGLEQATRATTKGRYHKGKPSFEILAELDPAKVRCKSPYADRFLCELERRSQ
jgi:hypothetical protein